MNNPELTFENMIYQKKFQDQFLEKRIVFLWGAVTDESSRKLTNELLFLEAKDPGKPIKLYINSPGGIVTSGMIVYDTMKMISSPVHTCCMGLAASMGSIILAGGTKGERTIWPSGRVMIHQPSIGSLFGQASDIQIHANEILRTKQKSAEILAENCSQTVKKIIEDFDRDYWMTADESLKYGIVDKLEEQIRFS